MVDFLYRRGYDRKLRLFAVACCRRICARLHSSAQESDERRIAVAERFADGFETADGLARLWETPLTDTEHGPPSACNPHPRWAARNAAIGAGGAALNDWLLAHPRALRRSPEARAAKHAEIIIVTGLLHCIFGNPFRPQAIEQPWPAAETVALARSIYEERRFQDLPVLGDALEEAGCPNADILNHCRQSGSHVRGCWVVDLLLEKS
jgi:hypothetical protein